MLAPWNATSPTRSFVRAATNCDSTSVAACSRVSPRANGCDMLDEMSNASTMSMPSPRVCETASPRCGRASATTSNTTASSRSPGNHRSPAPATSHAPAQRPQRPYPNRRLPPPRHAYHPSTGTTASNPNHTGSPNRTSISAKCRSHRSHHAPGDTARSPLRAAAPRASAPTPSPPPRPPRTQRSAGHMPALSAPAPTASPRYPACSRSAPGTNAAACDNGSGSPVPSPRNPSSSNRIDCSHHSMYARRYAIAISSVSVQNNPAAPTPTPLPPP